MTLGGNQFTNFITLVGGTTTPQDVATITVNPASTVGGQLAYTLYVPITDSTNEAQAGLVIFSLAKSETGAKSGALYTSIVAKGGTNTSGSLAWAVNTSGANPVITAAWTAGAATDGPVIGFAVNYYGGTWGGGTFPEAT